MISRLISPRIVRIPARSIALAFSPRWICGMISRPCSLKERYSQNLSVIPIFELTAFMVSARSFLHIFVFSLLFQSLVWMFVHFHCLRFCLSTFCCPVFSSMSGIRSPFSSLLYTFFCFGIHFPCSSMPRKVSMIWACRFRCPCSFSESWMAYWTHIPLLTKFRSQ